MPIYGIVFLLMFCIRAVLKENAFACQFMYMCVVSISKLFLAFTCDLQMKYRFWRGRSKYQENDFKSFAIVMSFSLVKKLFSI